MARRGKKRRLGLEDEYWKLIADGVGTVAACKQLGIGRKTGYRWRAETGGLPPQRDSEQMYSSRFLSLLDRQRMAALRSRGVGTTATSLMLGPNNAVAASGPGGWLGTANSVTWCRTSFGWSGARSRSSEGCVTPPPAARLARVSRDDLPGVVHRSQRSE